MSTRGLMTATATIERADATTGSTGEVTLSWSQIAADVPCALQLRDGGVTLSAPGIVTEVVGVLYVPPDTDLRPTTEDAPGDRVTIDGTVYYVTHVRAPAGRSRLLRAEVRRGT